MNREKRHSDFRHIGNRNCLATEQNVKGPKTKGLDFECLLYFLKSDQKSLDFRHMYLTYDVSKL